MVPQFARSTFSRLYLVKRKAMQVVFFQQQAFRLHIYLQVIEKCTVSYMGYLCKVVLQSSCIHRRHLVEQTKTHGLVSSHTAA